MSIACFWMEPTDRVRRWLRRYTNLGTCPVHGHYHQARSPIEDGPVVKSPEGYVRTEPMDWPHSDPRWPSRCECGYAFSDADVWQLFYEQIYETESGPAAFTIREAPPGAMWDAFWMRPGPWQGEDGLSLMVKLPGNREWLVDGPSSSGGRWTRTGKPPHVTANPSIRAGDYHGWLRDGQLVDAG